MPNKFHGDDEVLVRLDRSRHLRYTFSAYSKFQKTAGCSINSVFERASKALEPYPLPPEPEKPSDELLAARGKAFFDAISDDLIPLLLWSGLIHEDRTITPEDAEGFCDYAEGASFEEKKLWLITKIQEAVILSKARIPGDVEADAKKKIETSNQIPNSTPSPG